MLRDWSSDVCSSDLLTRSFSAKWRRMNFQSARRLNEAMRWHRHLKPTQQMKIQASHFAKYEQVSTLDFIIPKKRRGVNLLWLEFSHFTSRRMSQRLYTQSPGLSVIAKKFGNSRSWAYISAFFSRLECFHSCTTSDFCIFLLFYLLDFCYQQ